MGKVRKNKAGLAQMPPLVEMPPVGLLKLLLSDILEF
jgi:hypothetical protein